jgi:hypothetical protein
MEKSNRKTGSNLIVFDFDKMENIEFWEEIFATANLDFFDVSSRFLVKILRGPIFLKNTISSP